MREQDGYSMTTYTGELKTECIAQNMAKIKKSFPALEPGFYQVLIERLKDKGFSDQRLTDAVNNVIDTCQYPTPTLANFLSFDRRVKILDYGQLVDQITNHQASWDAFTKLKMEGKNYWVRMTDKLMFNLPDEI